MTIPTNRGRIEIDEPSFPELCAVMGAHVETAHYALLLRIYMAGARAMRDELERGAGARLEAALMGAYKDQ